MPQQPPVMRSVHGRDREWANIVEALARAEWGHPRVLIIEGTRGSGRSHMLRQVAAEARDRGRMVIEHQGWRPAPAIAHLTAELTQLVGQVAPRAAPFVVAWDDPPWAHAAFTVALERTMPAAPIFWVLTRRTETSAPAAERPARALCVELPPISQPALGVIAAELLGAPPSAELLNLTSVAAGNPGLLADLIRGLVDEGIVEVTRTAARLLAPQLPMRTRTALRHLVAELSPDAHHLVQVASVLDGPSRLDDLAALLDTTAVALIPAVTEAMNANLFRRDDERVVFSHELVQQFVAESVPRAVWRPVREAVARLGASEREADGKPADIRLLTPAELGVAQVVREGLTDNQAARRLGVSPHTVNYHLRHIYRKLGLRGRVELARLPWPEPPAAA